MQKPFIAVSLAIVIILSASVTTNAQGESAIHGIVKARADRSALPGAVVELQGNALSPAITTTTTAEGQFAFPWLVPGEYTLTVRLANFREEQYRLSLKPREVQTLELTLALRAVHESVEVAADAIPSVFSPGSTHLTSERLAELPLTQRTNLPDAIVAAAPGMIRGHDDFVHIRGHEVALNPSINGVQFWENAHAVFSPGLGVEYIDSMNVMTGGYSAEYGNRFGGILDVVTKRQRAPNTAAGLLAFTAAAITRNNDGAAHEHATGPGLCGTRCPSQFTQDVSIGWNATDSGNRPSLSFQFNIENLSNKFDLLSKESTMVQGQYSSPRVLSASLKIGF